MIRAPERAAGSLQNNARKKMQKMARKIGPKRKQSSFFRGQFSLSPAAGLYTPPGQPVRTSRSSMAACCRPLHAAGPTGAHIPQRHGGLLQASTCRRANRCAYPAAALERFEIHRGLLRRAAGPTDAARRPAGSRRRHPLFSVPFFRLKLLTLHAYSSAIA